MNAVKVSIQFCFLIMLLLSISVSQSLAGGSLPYEDMRAKFPDEGVTFSMLEDAFDIYKDDVFAQIRVLSDHPNKRFGGMRLGPYYVCAKQKNGKHLLVLITLTTENTYFDKRKRRQKDFYENTAFIKENIIGVRVEAASETNPFHRCYER